MICFVANIKKVLGLKSFWAPFEIKNDLMLVLKKKKCNCSSKKKWILSDVEIGLCWE